jgi:Fur family transcriptional regulator, iron response regulator
MRLGRNVGVVEQKRSPSAEGARNAPTAPLNRQPDLSYCRPQRPRGGRTNPRGTNDVTTPDATPAADQALLDLPAMDERLRLAGLRPTRQRCVLASILFGSGDRHVTAEMLHAEVVATGERVSLATVYNTLHQLKAAGLLREIALDAQRAYFDTNTSNHNHFYIEKAGPDKAGVLMDIPGDSIRVDGLPQPPDGMKISHIDVVVRLVQA